MMLEEDWQALVRLLTDKGLQVLALDRQTGVLVVKVRL